MGYRTEVFYEARKFSAFLEKCRTFFKSAELLQPTEVFEEALMFSNSNSKECADVFKIYVS
jgi:hypothetical protein